MKEIWKDIKGYEGLYQVSNLGNVKALLKHRYNSNALLKEHLLKPSKSKRNYLQVTLTKNNANKHLFVHRLVAKAFIPNPNNYPCVNHKDENNQNNNVNNLEWCTYAYNNSYGTRLNKLSKSQINHPKKSKQVNQYDLNGNFIKTWASISQINRELGFNSSHISQCCSHKRKKSHNYIWKYV